MRISILIYLFFRPPAVPEEEPEPAENSGNNMSKVKSN